MNSGFFHKNYGNVKIYVQRSPICIVFLEDNSTVNDPSFVRMVQLYTDKTVTSLKANAVVVYPVQVVSLNFTLEFCQFFIDHRLTFVKLLPISKTSIREEPVQLSQELSDTQIPAITMNDVFPRTTERSAKTVKSKLLHDFMQKIIQPLKE